MTGKIRKRVSRRGAVRSIALAAGTVAAVTAAAQIAEPRAPLRFRTNYLGYAASVSPRVIFTDNIDLLPDDLKEDEVILSTLFTGTGIVSNRRFTALFKGDLDFAQLVEDSDFRVNQDVGGVGTVTLADNFLYFDFSGRTTRQLVGDNARFSANVNASRGQRANVHSFSTSPYVFRQFADRSAMELRYRFTQVFVDDSQSDFNNNAGQDLLNDSRSHEIVAAYDTGSKFDRLRFRLSAYGNNTVESGSDIAPRFEYEQGTLAAEGEFALTDHFSLSGAIGYDDIETRSIVSLFDDDALSGLFWRAGFTTRPGRRSTLRLEYGRRYDDHFIDAELTYALSQRLRLRAGAGRSFQTRSQSVNSRFQMLSQETLEFADRLRSGEELDPNAVIEAATRVNGGLFDSQTVGIGASNDAYVQIDGAFDLTNVSLTANYQDTDFGFSQNENIQTVLNISRQLSRRLEVYGGAFYRRADVAIDEAACIEAPFIFGFDPTVPGFDAVAACTNFSAVNGVTNTVGGRIGTAWRIYENLSLFGEYSYTTRFAPSPELEYDENAVAVGLTLDL